MECIYNNSINTRTSFYHSSVNDGDISTTKIKISLQCRLCIIGFSLCDMQLEVILPVYSVTTTHVIIECVCIIIGMSGIMLIIGLIVHRILLRRRGLQDNKLYSLKDALNALPH